MAAPARGEAPGIANLLIPPTKPFANGEFRPEQKAERRSRTRIPGPGRSSPRLKVVAPWTLMTSSGSQSCLFERCLNWSISLCAKVHPFGQFSFWRRGVNPNLEAGTDSRRPQRQDITSQAKPAWGVGRIDFLDEEGATEVV